MVDEPQNDNKSAFVLINIPEQVQLDCRLRDDGAFDLAFIDEGGNPIIGALFDLEKIIWFRDNLTMLIDGKVNGPDHT